jgi:regulator of replication initiation timing
MDDLMKNIEAAIASARATMEETARQLEAANERLAMLQHENNRLQREVERLRGLATVGRRWGRA